MGEIDRSWLQGYNNPSEPVSPVEGRLSRVGSGLRMRPDSRTSMTSINGKVVIRPRNTRVDGKSHMAPRKLKTGSFFDNLLERGKTI